MNLSLDPVPPGFEARLRARFAAADVTLEPWVSADGCTLTDRGETQALLVPGGSEFQPVVLDCRQRLRPKREPKNHREGLLVVDREPLAAHGECPGGHYSYVTDPGFAVQLLDWWASQRAWAAVDLETAVGWRKSVDPQSGVWTKRWADGSDAFTSAIMLGSVSVEPGEAVVFDFRLLGEHPGFREAFRRFLTECRLVCHNAQFEQGFFQAQLGVLANVRIDTMVLHQLLTAGLPEKSDLESVTTKYMGLGMEKKWQKFFIQIHPESPLPNDAIRYSAGDVCQLLAIARQIEAEYLASGQYPIWKEIEQPFMAVIAAATFQGITVDREKLQALKRKAERERDRHLQAFQNLAPGVLISSWQQVLAWFSTHAVTLESTSEKCLASVIAHFPQGSAPAQAAAAILGYRGAAKMASTYIQPYLTDLVNPVSGRIHPQWKQASTSTGRMAAAKPNLQNIPAGGDYLELREAIVAAPGMLLAWLDYSQFEVRALADAANEPKMLAVFREAFEVNRALEALVAEYGLDYTLEGLTELPEKKPGQWRELSDRFPDLCLLVQQAYGCDFHRRTAATLFKKPVTAVTREERRKAKCFHPDTEVLTRTGWKRILDLQPDEEVIQATPSAGGAVTLAWTVPLEVFSLTHDSGQLVHLCNQGIDLRVTPDHRMLTWTAQGHVKVRLPGDLNHAYYWANAGKLADGARSGIASLLLQLAVATQADGSYTKSAIRFGFTRQRKIDRLRSLLDAAAIPYTRSHGKNAVTTFRVGGESAARIKALLDNKRFPWWWLDLPHEQRILILDEVAHWDATQLPGKRLVRVTSAQEQNLDVLQAMGALTGRKSRISRKSDYPNVSLKDHALSRGGHVKTTVIPHTEAVACLAVPSTFVLVRDRGVAVITGQTITFALPYGAGPKGVAEQAQISRDEAVHLIREYERQFPRVKRFLEECKQAGRNGTTQTAAGRKRRYLLPNFHRLHAELEALAADPDRRPEWEVLQARWRSTDPIEIAQSRVRAETGAIEREATNQPIQGVNADATKLASVLAAPRMAALAPTCTITMWVHDEIVITAPAALIRPAAAIMEEGMVGAALTYLKKCPIETSCSIGPRWGK